VHSAASLGVGGLLQCWCPSQQAVLGGNSLCGTMLLSNTPCSRLDAKFGSAALCGCATCDVAQKVMAIKGAVAAYLATQMRITSADAQSLPNRSMYDYMEVLRYR
jgi:hypothetical protein